MTQLWRHTKINYDVTGMFEGDIRMSSQQLVDFVRANYERDDVIARQPRSLGDDDGDMDYNMRQMGGATMTLPIWTFYKKGDNYLVPYVIDGTIGYLQFYIFICKTCRILYVFFFSMFMNPVFSN